MKLREMTLRKTTKNTYVYDEVVPAGETAVFPVVYIQKSALPTRPQRITLTLRDLRPGEQVAYPVEGQDA